MLEIGKIAIEERVDTNTSASKKLRRLGSIPGVVYSKGKETLHIAVKNDELRRGVTKYGRNALYELMQNGDKLGTVMIKEVQNNPVKGDILHVDFVEVFMDEEIKAEIGIRLIGVELLEAQRFLVLRQTDLIQVRGLPQLIPDYIEVDISELNVGDSINIGEIKFPEGIFPDEDLDQVVVSVTVAKQEEEEDADGEGDEVDGEAEAEDIDE